MDIESEIVESRTEAQAALPRPLCLPGGLPPFKDARRYRIIPAHQCPPFARIECEDQDVSFVLIDPRRVHPRYVPEFFESDWSDVGLAPGVNALIMAIVNLSRGVEHATVNLVGPLLINPSTGVGKQVVLKNASVYLSRHPLLKQAPDSGD